MPSPVDDLREVFARDPDRAFVAVIERAHAPAATQTLTRVLVQAGVDRKAVSAAWSKAKGRVEGHPHIVKVASRPPTYRWSSDAVDHFAHLRTMPIDTLLAHLARKPSERHATADEISARDLSPAARLAAAGLGITPWLSAADLNEVNSAPIALGRDLAALSDGVLQATTKRAEADNRLDVLWALATTATARPGLRTLPQRLAADPDARQRAATLIRSLADAADAGAERAIATTLRRLATVPLDAHASPSLVTLLTAKPYRGAPGRGVVDAALALLARSAAPPPSPDEAAPTPTPSPSTPAASGIDVQRLLDSQTRQARIDGLRAALSLLSELQTYPPGDRDPRALWAQLVDLAADHGIAPIGRPGERLAFDAEAHDLLDEDDAATVRVVRSGYTWTRGGDTVVVQRAQVRYDGD